MTHKETLMSTLLELGNIFFLEPMECIYSGLFLDKVINFNSTHILVSINFEVCVP